LISFATPTIIWGVHLKEVVDLQEELHLKEGVHLQAVRIPTWRSAAWGPGPKRSAKAN